MNSKLKTMGLVAFGATAAVAVLLALHARAAGVPEADGMTYTGYLESAAGTPLTGDHSIAVQFWDSEAATEDLCTGKLDSVELQSGRFQVPLPVSCSDAVKASPDIWVSVDVDGASLGRSKLGSVPFALEAGHATTADSASAAAGDLLQQLTEIENDLGAEHTLRARINGSDGAVLEQSGTWVSAVRSGAGGYNLAFKAGSFSATPTCVVSHEWPFLSPPIVRTWYPSKDGIVVGVTQGTEGVDAVFNIICVGPR